MGSSRGYQRSRSSHFDCARSILDGNSYKNLKCHKGFHGNSLGRMQFYLLESGHTQARNKNYSESLQQMNSLNKLSTHLSPAVHKTRHRNKTAADKSSSPNDHGTTGSVSAEKKCWDRNHSRDSSERMNIQGQRLVSQVCGQRPELVAIKLSALFVQGLVTHQLIAQAKVPARKTRHEMISFPIRLWNSRPA